MSPGCDRCYAEKMSARQAGKGAAVYTASVYLKARDGRTGWTGRITRSDDVDEMVLHQPWRWKKPKMIFVSSMSDLFHPSVPLNWILRVFVVMAGAPQHTFQVLTKRPGRMAYFANHHLPEMSCGTITWPDNVWAGTSLEMMEDGAKRYFARLDLLAQVPAKVRFVSAEPLLGPLDLRPWLQPSSVMAHGDLDNPETASAIANLARAAFRQKWGLSWVIAGGESGPGARPCHPDWVRSLRDQCQAAGVAFHFKQWGEWIPVENKGYAHSGYATDFSPPLTMWVDIEGKAEEYVTGNGGLFMRRVGKKAAGAVLDGREHRGFPL